MNKNAIKRKNLQYFFLALFKIVSCALILFFALIWALFDPFIALFWVQKSGHTDSGPCSSTTTSSPRRRIRLLLARRRVRLYTTTRPAAGSSIYYRTPGGGFVYILPHARRRVRLYTTTRPAADPATTRPAADPATTWPVAGLTAGPTTTQYSPGGGSTTVRLAAGSGKTIILCKLVTCYFLVLSLFTKVTSKIMKAVNSMMSTVNSVMAGKWQQLWVFRSRLADVAGGLAEKVAAAC